MVSKHKKYVEPLRLIIAKPFLGVHPHVLSALGLLSSVFFMYALVNHWYGAALFAIAGNIFDMVDGTVAKLQKKASYFGFFLDSTLDRASDFLLISSFGFAGIVRWEFVCILLMLSFLISFIRSRTELTAMTMQQVSWEKVKQDVGIIERPERIMLLTCCVLGLLLLPDQIFFSFSLTETLFIFLIILSTTTVVQRFLQAYKVLKK